MKEIGFGSLMLAFLRANEERDPQKVIALCKLLNETKIEVPDMVYAAVNAYGRRGEHFEDLAE